MAVYVGPLFAVEKRTKTWQWPRACHMVADSSDELDDMAERLMLKENWKQKPLTHQEHFDLNGAKRKTAIRLGAKEVTEHQIGEIMRRKEERGTH